MLPMIAPAVKLDRMLLMWNSQTAYSMLEGSDDGQT